jgi:hypothetical protein
MSGAMIWQLSRARWGIETVFRNLKQYLGFGTLGSSSKEAAHLAICLPILIYVNFEFFPERYGLNEADTIGQKLDKMFLKNQADSIIGLMQGRLQHKAAQFLARQCPSRSRQKPLDWTKESEKMLKTA